MLYEPHPIKDRLYLPWLAIGLIILLISNGMQIIPIATWLGPVFLVRSLRTQQAWLGLLLGYIAITMAFIISWRPAVESVPRAYLRNANANLLT